MTFWKWWTSIVILALSLGFIQYNIDILGFIYENDPTRITMLIAFIFLLSTIKVGIESWKRQFSYDNQDELSMIWFISDAVMSIGMIGTLVGFIIVLTTTFTEIDTTSAQAMKEVISKLAQGMGIALLTTLTGLVTSVILKLQLVMLDTDDEKI
tara:strand:- start:62 stop:523 length:462 start_codon:yes stop_codon:yes gene_type:complete